MFTFIRTEHRSRNALVNCLRSNGGTILTNNVAEILLKGWDGLRCEAGRHDSGYFFTTAATSMDTAQKVSELAVQMHRHSQNRQQRSASIKLDPTGDLTHDS
jgi:transcriptional regulator with AAA-type ATPase domain